ncbi:DUF4144 family protein [Shewanella sp.]|uniref:DUF4144 family protein n=1 Tax=Shewanella sp. TaxID=50422 RepID=UPI003A982688
MTTAPKNELTDVCWPALWLAAQADELVVVEDLHDLIALAGEQYRLVNVADRLIDSQLQQWCWQDNAWLHQPARCTLVELTEHFRRHAALCNVCCLEKLTFPDFTTLINTLKSID